MLIFKCKKPLNQSVSNITHTCAHTHLGVQADLVAHRLVFRSGFVSRNSASVQSVNAISHVCLLPARCFHCLLFFFPSFPPPLCLLLRVPCWGFFFLFFFWRALIHSAATFSLQPFRAPNLIPLTSTLFFSSSTLSSASAQQCRRDVISFLNWVNAAGPRDLLHV